MQNRMGQTSCTALTMSYNKLPFWLRDCSFIEPVSFNCFTSTSGRMPSESEVTIYRLIGIWVYDLRCALWIHGSACPSIQAYCNCITNKQMHPFSCIELSNLLGTYRNHGCLRWALRKHLHTCPRCDRRQYGLARACGFSWGTKTARTVIPHFSENAFRLFAPL